MIKTDLEACLRRATPGQLTLVVSPYTYLQSSAVIWHYVGHSFMGVLLTLGPNSELSSKIRRQAMDEVPYPRNVRKWLTNLRLAVEKQNIAACLITTHPVVLDEFKGREEHILVQTPDGVQTLLELFGEEYLAHFSPADLYMRGVFGNDP